MLLEAWADHSGHPAGGPQEGRKGRSELCTVDRRGVGLKGVPTLSLVAVWVLAPQVNALEEVWEHVLA